MPGGYEKFPTEKDEGLTAMGTFSRVLCGAGLDDYFTKGEDLLLKRLPIRTPPVGTPGAPPI